MYVVVCGRSPKSLCWPKKHFKDHSWSGQKIGPRRTSLSRHRSQWPDKLTLCDSVNDHHDFCPARKYVSRHTCRRFEEHTLFRFSTKTPKRCMLILFHRLGELEWVVKLQRFFFAKLSKEESQSDIKSQIARCYCSWVYSLQWEASVVNII